MKQAAMLLRILVLIALAIVLTLSLVILALLSFVVYSATQTRSWNAPVGSISEHLTFTADGGYAFDGQVLLERQQLWAMLVDENGDVVWSAYKPDDVPDQYSLTDVSSFTRWYLHDYPVQCRVREDGLLVIGAPKDSAWKYTVTVSMDSLHILFYGVPLLVLLCISGAVGLCAVILRRWFLSEQTGRDQARADWVSGVSHDIRTPLSMVMGYASELEHDPTLPAHLQNKASILVRQSQRIKELVGDLNLTMRLDYAMQPLRKAELNPAALVRQVAADFLNSGLEAPLSVDLPPDIQPITADGFLLRRALYNLVYNAIQHNPDDVRIEMGLRYTAGRCVLWVQSQSTQPSALPLGGDSGYGIAPDGGAPHGTGLKLVEQIARAHGGKAVFRREDRQFLCEIWVPA